MSGVLEPSNLPSGNALHIYKRQQLKTNNTE